MTTGASGLMRRVVPSISSTESGSVSSSVQTFAALSEALARSACAMFSGVSMKATAWWTTPRLPGRNSTDCTHLSSLKPVGILK